MIMMTLLIAMFSDRYVELRKHTPELFLFRRACFCLTQEKLFPQWYYKLFGLQIGIPLGVGRRFSPEEGEEQPLLHKQRWILWRGGSTSFRSWREKVKGEDSGFEL